MKKKEKEKDKEPVGVANAKGKDDEIKGKNGKAEEVKGALSQLRDLLEELKEKSSKSKKDSADNQKRYGFGAGIVSLNTSNAFQTKSTSTYVKPVGAAKGSAIHIKGGSDSRSNGSFTPIVNKGAFSLGSSNNKLGALSAYQQIQDVA